MGKIYDLSKKEWIKDEVGETQSAPKCFELETLFNKYPFVMSVYTYAWKVARAVGKSDDEACAFAEALVANFPRL